MSNEKNNPADKEHGRSTDSKAETILKNAEAAESAEKKHTEPSAAEEKQTEAPKQPEEKKKLFAGKDKETEKKLHEKEEEIKKLKEQCESLKTDNTKLKTEYLKAYADTENTKKRLERDFDQQNKYRIQGFAKEILPVLDNCERAMNVKSEDENYRKAFTMVHKSLTAALKNEGVEEIECLNQPYDANWHQAMMTEHVDGLEPGIITEVLQKGYKLKDRLLRAAMVKVSE
ncbi:MAG: nucleotide exchange factor GrpE [Erysipelotrichia bacterium]|nr:nucleotide exchange factor GrpE [Erysipelotrichia bacterium]